MQRRTVVRGLAGATLAIVAGDLAVLAARLRPHPPSSSHPLFDETVPPGPPRTPRRPGLADRIAGPPPPQAPQLSTRALICRDSWGARPPMGPLTGHRIERFTVHHTAVVATDTTVGSDRIRDYQRYHQRRGLGDLAYHMVIDRAGNIFEGRPLSTAPGTFTRYDTTGHFTACLDGNFEVQSPTSEQLDALVDVLAWISQRFAVNPATIRGHRAYAVTRCPGAALDALIVGDTLRRRVDERRTAGRIELVHTCGAPGATGVVPLV